MDFSLNWLPPRPTGCWPLSMRETVLASTCDHMILMTYNVIYIYIFIYIYIHVYVGDLVDASRCY